jgi:2-polyprenyl-3-methyl-5-hydroxy-6-metoxy-1,4-benzoquinol methylase
MWVVGGVYLLTFLKMGAKEVAGQDLDAKAIERAKTICDENGFQCDAKTGSCTELLFEDNYFDCVFSGDLFEHITDEMKIESLAEIFRVLKPGGTVTIKTPNKNYLRLSLLFKRLSAILKLKNPLSMHIAHTRNNPDNEHHGLTTHRKMREFLLQNTFHEPTITYHALEREGFPKTIAKLLKNNLFFNEHVIITARKPVFYGLYK